MNFGTPELLIVLVIVILLFGVGRISKISGELGKSIRAFRENLSEKNDSATGEESDNADPDKKS